MSNIQNLLKRLRNAAKTDALYTSRGLLVEAADEIEKILMDLSKAYTMGVRDGKWLMIDHMKQYFKETTL